MAAVLLWIYFDARKLRNKGTDIDYARVTAYSTWAVFILWPVGMIFYIPFSVILVVLVYLLKYRKKKVVDISQGQQSLPPIPRRSKTILVIAVASLPVLFFLWIFLALGLSHNL
ncbi:MAG: hypothetical protein HY093_01240 [Candidatus Liptonbacteria bacterium]|nr:hypothetical protein [Candidatus Liptonbacteria bacterium]